MVKLASAGLSHSGQVWKVLVKFNWRFAPSALMLLANAIGYIVRRVSAATRRRRRRRRSHHRQDVTFHPVENLLSQHSCVTRMPLAVSRYLAHVDPGPAGPCMAMVRAARRDKRLPAAMFWINLEQIWDAALCSERTPSCCRRCVRT